MGWAANYPDLAEDYVPGQPTDFCTFPQTSGPDVLPSPPTKTTCNPHQLQLSQLSPGDANLAAWFSAVPAPSQNTSQWGPVVIDSPNNPDPNPRAHLRSSNCSQPAVALHPFSPLSHLPPQGQPNTQNTQDTSVIGQRQKTRQRRRTTDSQNTASGLFQCKWEGCRYHGAFGRECDLVRHIKTLHISPGAHPCLVEDCTAVFNRGDNLQEHMRRCHYLS